jgi:large subunit ribosomal protein L30
VSTKPKRKPKPRATRKETAKPVRKRKLPEAKKGPISVAEKKPEKKIVEPIREQPLFLAVRLQGPFGIPNNLSYTLSALRLNRRFNAALLEKNASSLGMLRLAKDYVTWGEVGSESIAPLLRKRAELLGGMHLTDKYVKEKFGQASVEELAQALTRGRVSLKMLWRNGVKPVFRLRPPSGGFESSIKRPFGSEGELGYRGEGISALLARMM